MRSFEEWLADNPKPLSQSVLDWSRDVYNGAAAEAARVGPVAAKEERKIYSALDAAGKLIRDGDLLRRDDGTEFVAQFHTQEIQGSEVRTWRAKFNNGTVHSLAGAMHQPAFVIDPERRPRLTEEQAIIISGYTGTLCCEFGALFKDMTRRAGRPFHAAEMHSTWARELYKEDFMRLIPMSPMPEQK